MGQQGGALLAQTRTSPARRACAREIIRESVMSSMDATILLGTIGRLWPSMPCKVRRRPDAWG
jgi:hypothetical protein